MAKALKTVRLDHKDRALRKGESQRKKTKEYIYTYRDSQGNRKQITAVNLIDLRKREEVIKRDMADGLDAYLAGQATVNYLYERYISKKTELRSTTKSNYMYMYDKYVRNTLGEKKISKVVYSTILDFYVDLLENKKLQLNTIDVIQTVLRPTFQMAVRDNIIRVNPCSGVMAELKRKNPRFSGVRHALTPEQQKAFIDFLRSEPKYKKWEILFTVLLGTGCRIGEVIGLRWEDVDLENRVISVNHAVTYYARREGTTVCSFAVSLPKTEAGIREVPIIDSVKRAFEEEYAFQSEVGFCTVELDGMTGFIFSNRFGNLHNPAAVNRAIRRIIADHNSQEEVKAKRENRNPVIIPHFSCHHLRHTFCSRLCENETNIKVIQTIMGHKDIETTLDIYAEVSRNKKVEAMKELAETIKVF